MVPFGLFPADMLWIFDRDQVVDEDHEARAGALFEPGDDRWLMQVMMRYQQTHEVASAGTQLTVQRPPAAAE